MNTSKRVLAVTVICLAAAACTKKDVKETSSPGYVPPPASTSGLGDNGVSAVPGKYGPGDLDSDTCLRQRVVYFDLDQDGLKPEFQAIVACHAKYLRDRPQAQATLEGNADERGSREYNVALGERRGNAVSAAAQASGASTSQVNVRSYGEERPVCTESNEDCWSKNRRVEIVYTSK